MILFNHKFLQGMKKSLVVLIGFVFFMSSCGKDDKTAPTVEITSPLEGAQYNAGDIISFKAIVKENEMLEHLRLASDAGLDTEIRTFDSFTEHHADYNITLDTATAPGIYWLKLEAYDEAGNKGEDAINFQVVE